MLKLYLFTYLLTYLFSCPRCRAAFVCTSLFIYYLFKGNLATATILKLCFLTYRNPGRSSSSTLLRTSPVRSSTRVRDISTVLTSMQAAQVAATRLSANWSRLVNHRGSSDITDCRALNDRPLVLCNDSRATRAARQIADATMRECPPQLSALQFISQIQ